MANAFSAILSKNFYFINHGNAVTVEYTDIKQFDPDIHYKVIRYGNKILIHDSSATSEQFQISEFFNAFIDLCFMQQQYEEVVDERQRIWLANLLYQVLDQMEFNEKGTPISIKVLNKVITIHFDDTNIWNYDCSAIYSEPAQSIHISKTDNQGNNHTPYTKYQMLFHEVWHLLFGTIGLYEDENTYKNEHLVDLLGFLTAELFLTVNNNGHKKSYDKLLEANKI